MSKTNRYSPKVRERTVRLVEEARKDYPSLCLAIESIAPKIGCATVTLHEWVEKHEIDTGMRDGVTTAPGQRDSAAGQCVFRACGAQPPQEEVRSFIDQHRERFGIEPICKLSLSLPAEAEHRYYAQLTEQAQPRPVLNPLSLYETPGDSIRTPPESERPR